MGNVDGSSVCRGLIRAVLGFLFCGSEAGSGVVSGSSTKECLRFCGVCMDVFGTLVGRVAGVAASLYSDVVSPHCPFWGARPGDALPLVKVALDLDSSCPFPDMDTLSPLGDASGRRQGLALASRS